MPLAHYGCPIGQKALSDAQQVYMPNVAQNMAKSCQKLHKIDRKSSQQHKFWPMGLFFLTFWPEPVNLKGGRLPEKPLKTLLTHQSDYRPRKKGKVAFLEFHCDHVQG